jgi:hypothetical protein
MVAIIHFCALPTQAPNKGGEHRVRDVNINLLGLLVALLTSHNGNKGFQLP